MKIFLLKLLSLIYYCSYHIWFFLQQQKNSYKASLPVISVGNITSGGTGKTPFVSWLISFLQELGYSPIVFTRGYKSKTKKMRLLTQIENKLEQIRYYGDEPALLSLKHPETPIAIYAKRACSLAKYANLGNIAILDDGMQHLKVQRDLDLSLVDSTVGFGNKKLQPVGMLREPLTALQRNDIILLTKTNLQKDKKFVNNIVQTLPKNKKYFKLGLKLASLLESKGLQKIPLTNLQNKECIIFCGIANPKSFEMLLTAYLGKNGKIIKNFYFPDHFNYNKINLAKIFSSKKNSKRIYLTTEKDWVKLIAIRKQLPLFYVVKTELIIPLLLKKELENRLKIITKTPK